MKSFIKISLLLLLHAAAPAQQGSVYELQQRKQLDSLQIAVKNAANDTIRMDLYQKLATFYGEVNVKRDSSLYFSEQQLVISQKLKLKLWEAGALDNIGFSYWQFGNFPQAMQYLIQALKISGNPESEKPAWGLSKDETPGKARLKVLASNHRNLGLVYGESGNTDQQLFHYRQSEKFAAEIDDMHQLSLADMNLGGAYTKLGKLDSALLFSFKALDYNNQSVNKRRRGRILGNIGSIYLKKRDYTLAKKYFSEALQESQVQFNSPTFARACLNLAGLFTQTENSDSSLLYARKAAEVFQRTGPPSGLMDAYNLLASIYKLKRNVDSAFKYQGLTMAINDSLNRTEKVIQLQNIGFEEQIRLRELDEERIQIQNKIRTYTLLASIAVFMLIAFILFINNRLRKKANTLLEKQKAQLQAALQELKSTQALLIQSEKMASLGELTAGIAHEIQNPLNFVNNFSEVSNELIDEMSIEIDKGNNEEVKAIANDIKQNLEKINHHGKRAGAIVKGMLQHSQTSTGQKEPTDINKLADEYLRLAYHGLRAKDKSFNAILKTDFDETIGNINVIPQDIGRVLLNLYNNAFYAVTEKKQQPGESYEPTVTVSSKKIGDKVLIVVKDNGNGIPQKIVDKIFQPFFTTKPTGQGTGLGLSLAYDIVKAHGGELKVETNVGEYSEFIIQLPV